jgi:hypothetical protein
MPIPIRNFKDDLARIAGTNDYVLLSPDSSQQVTASSTSANTDASTSTSNIRGNSRGEAAVGSGPKGARILQVAQSLLGTDNNDYFPGRPGDACASFVSTVLIKAGVMPQSSFTRSASQLTSSTERAGAVNVFGGLIPSTDENIFKAQPGDVVQLVRGDVRGAGITHSGIATGKGGMFISIGSSHGRVIAYKINYLRAGVVHFVKFQLHRFGG